MVGKLNCLDNEILEFIERVNASSGNHNGATFNQLKSHFELDKVLLSNTLNNLFKNNKIIIKKGVNNQLIFVNYGIK